MPRRGIIEAWLLLPQSWQIEVLRSPTANGYQQRLVLPAGDSVTPLLVPQFCDLVGSAALSERPGYMNR
jgi:Uma2 family endonuclease